MQRDAGMIDEALEKLAEQIDIELADARAGEVHVKLQAGTAGEINHHP